MKIIKFPEGREQWKLWRGPKFTGSKISKIITKNSKGELVFDPTGPLYARPKVGIYHAIAAKLIDSALLAADEDAERAMERGTRLEPAAIERFKQETGKKAVWHPDDVGWERDDESRIAVSPDASIGKTEAVEAKCLSASRHLQAIDTGEVPSDYWYQVLQYFVVNDKLKTLYVVFYDDRFPRGLDYFCIPVKRKDVQEDADALLEHERLWLKVVTEKTIQFSDRIVATPLEAPVTVQEEQPIEMFPVITVSNIRDNGDGTLTVEVLESKEEGLARVAAGIKDRDYE